MSRPTYTRVPDTDVPGSTAFRSISRRESESNLVPRTPHSRAGDQTHFGQDDSEMNNDSFESYELTRQSQTAPLLASSTSATFGDRLADAESRTRPPVARRRRSGVLNQIPLLIGGVFSVFLCLLIFISIQWPDTLQAWLKTSEVLDKTPSSGVAPAVGNNPASENTGGKMHNHTTTIDYSAYTSFPLSPMEYLAECWKQQADHYHGGYWAKPPGGAADVPHPTSDSKTCSSTITFMFDGNRGLMADLALIAQLAGLAREQNRTFLIDDRLWNRGNWTTHFQDIRKTQPGPEPGCLPPQPEELVACPRTARHWIVTPRTAKFHFGHDFSEEFQDPYAYSTARLKPIFTRAFDSLESFIILSDKNIQLVRRARSELRRRIQTNTGSGAVANYMSVHIRRGDRKAMSWEYIKSGSDGYVPLANYVEAAQSTWSNFGPPGKAHVYVASDDPVSLDEFTKLSDAHVYSLRQWGIDGGRAREGSVTDAAEELAELASPSAYVQSEWMNRTEEQRIRLTRGMIVEMALLSELWDGDLNEEDDGLELVATVCTLTSNVCKLAAIGLGWPNALESSIKAWVEIDNRNNIEPEWEAFEII